MIVSRSVWYTGRSCSNGFRIWNYPEIRAWIKGLAGNRLDTWHSEEWENAAAEFTAGKHCEWHGPSVTTNLVPHHPRFKNGRKIYYTHDQYLSLEGCITLCSNCNFMESKGYRLCPKCGKNYYKPKKAYDPLCWACFIETDYGATIDAYQKSHPEQFKKKPKFKTAKKKISSLNF